MGRLCRFRRAGCSWVGRAEPGQGRAPYFAVPMASRDRDVLPRQYWAKIDRLPVTEHV